MQNLILIGASGFGIDIADRIMMLPEYNKSIIIKGFLVHKKEYLHSLDNYPNYPPILGLVEDYEIKKDDVFLCTLGDVKEKETIVSFLKNKGAHFFTFIHPLANVSKDVVIGEGSIILEYATIGPGAEVGAFCLIQIASIIAHGNKVGDFSRIDCHVVCVGNVQIGNMVTIHTSAVINHGVIVGDGSVVGALSFVVRKVKPCTTVWGTPAKTLKF